MNTKSIDAPTRTGPSVAARTPEVVSLNEVACELAASALAVRAAAADTTTVAINPRLLLSGLRSPRTLGRGLAGLARALTNPAGLGWAPVGRGLARAAWLAGVLGGRENLATTIAVTGLKVRIRAAAFRHPELLGDGPVGRLLTAIETDRQVEAATIFKRLLNEQGTQHALAAIAPSFADITAWNALVDENPFNDGSGWAIATGGVARSDPLLGFSIQFWARWDRGEGRAEPIPIDDELGRSLTSGGIEASMRNIAAVGTTGRVLIQSILGPDGVTRYLVHLPGLAFGGPCQDSPQDIVGAFNAVSNAKSPYSRAVSKALAHLAPEAGAEIAIVGHSQGGIVALNLAGDQDLNDRYVITHVVAVGSPVDYKHVARPETKVFSLVNEHDIVPALDGRSAVSPFTVPDNWLELTWTDSTHAFPRCHGAVRYADNLADLPEVSGPVDTEMARYRGKVTGNHLYRLLDR